MKFTIRRRIARGFLATILLYTPITKANTLYGLVVNVADGDTITVLDPSKKQHRIRLAHIDAPERGQAYGRVAQKALNQKISKRQVQIKYKEKDRYGRILGEVFLNSENVNLWLVQKGLAWPYFRYNPSKYYLDAHRIAQMYKTGLWQDPNPIEPETFRREQSKK